MPFGKVAKKRKIGKISAESNDSPSSAYQVAQNMSVRERMTKKMRRHRASCAANVRSKYDVCRDTTQFSITPVADRMLNNYATFNVGCKSKLVALREFR